MAATVRPRQVCLPSQVLCGGRRQQEGTCNASRELQVELVGVPWGCSEVG